MRLDIQAAAKTTHASPLPATEELGGTIMRMDALAQTGFAGIAGLAKAALEGREGSGSPVPHTDALADALRAIWGLAEQAGNDINCVAEEAEHNHVRNH